MVIVLKKEATQDDIESVAEKARRAGCRCRISRGKERTLLIAVETNGWAEALAGFAALDFVESVIPISKQYKLASRLVHPHASIIDVSGTPVGGDTFVVMAGPCCVEEETILEAAEGIKIHGAHVLRGGAFKPRTSPYSFQGLGNEGLRLLERARELTGLPVVTELLSEAHLGAVVASADLIQIGTRNAQNTALLCKVAESQKPVLLKRGMACTIEEWLMAAEYLLANGNPNVILCERGIRSFETMTRNTLDLSAVAVAKQETHLPVVVDPSHGTGVRELVIPMARAAVAAGADGLLVEVHPSPDRALSDGAQSLNMEQFGEMMHQIEPFVRVMGRTLQTDAVPAVL
ncbi:MAG: 3-deoxy-7-phosphoheptulonate synthase [Candidatus Abyssobacteria bacterium SURF_5]|uniref:3-deoxy-7-phosphoheptulonate synthase n=1 Tax=Abyssobacteria bacterium (strain SURF_5) TaxID=2093360 RepID=A0A3A4NP39_ABYX5|nr:MAG: 3-deoxy-7-phosphoheptulonate synthase [Candidatus Abyssubacteria bacterium SURF_5]